MCLAVPMQIEKIENESATVNVGGTKRDVNIAFLDDADIGDYILVHAGFAIKKIDEKEAEETVKLLNKMAEIARNDNSDQS
ncbi:MAG: HypC/HybG/HupF family hydrogenase formation chaperone [Deltaproteobacteria bacterium]|jgi:hydrogenase expression/formation protein HypC|nr:HypC/HybG/HupF family hydrogenase formation chaperone [Deltaproteobacteria bacterium]